MASTDKIFLYDTIPFEITLLKADNTAYSVFNADVLQFKFLKPDGTTISRDASLINDGSDGQITYVTTDTDLDQVGMWRYQIYIKKDIYQWHSNIDSFRVFQTIG